VLIPPILPASYRIRAESANPGGCQKEESAGCCRGALICPAPHSAIFTQLCCETRALLKSWRSSPVFTTGICQFR